MMDPFNQHGGIIMYSNRNINNPVCCVVIPSRYGVPLVLTVWIGLSIYFSCLSFMGKSPFYSHIDKAALIVFGIVNLLFIVLCLFGYTLHLVSRSLNRYRTYAKLIACCIAVIVLDMFANFVIFCIKQNDFYSWCQNKALNDMNYSMQQQNINSTQVSMIDSRVIEATIVFNCNRLFDAEAKFGIAALVCITIVYVYWAGFINSVSHNFVVMRPKMTIQPRQQPPPLPTTAAAATAIVDQQNDASNHALVLPDIPPPSARKQSMQHSSIILL